MALASYIVDAILIILGVIASRVVYSGLYKSSKTAGKAFSYFVGMCIAAASYYVWYTTGLDPVQLAICSKFPDGPVCVGKRVGGAGVTIANKNDKGLPSLAEDVKRTSQIIGKAKIDISSQSGRSGAEVPSTRTPQEDIWALRNAKAAASGRRVGMEAAQRTIDWITGGAKPSNDIPAAAIKISDETLDNLNRIFRKIEPQIRQVERIVVVGKFDTEGQTPNAQETVALMESSIRNYFIAHGVPHQLIITSQVPLPLDPLAITNRVLTGSDRAKGGIVELDIWFDKSINETPSGDWVQNTIAF